MTGTKHDRSDAVDLLARKQMAAQAEQITMLQRAVNEMASRMDALLANGPRATPDVVLAQGEQMAMLQRVANGLVARVDHLESMLVQTQTRVRGPQAWENDDR